MNRGQFECRSRSSRGGLLLETLVAMVLMVMVGLLALLLTNMALLANLARIEKRFFFIEADALAIVVVYLVGMYMLFLQGA